MLSLIKKTYTGYRYYLAYLLLSTIFICCLILASSALLSNKAYGHALKENTAKITLRDGQVEILLQLDLAHWKTRLQDNRAWLTGQISELMPATLTPEQQSQFLRSLLIKKTRLAINDEKLLLEQIAFLPQSHHGFTPVKLVGSHGQKQINHLDMHFPPSLGAVYTSVAKPQYQMIPAGKSARVAFGSQRVAKTGINKTHQHQGEAHSHQDTDKH
ncbi:hypothetical protein [Thalassomonas actiniarum]|uniref:Uncharacterized protein n=1 Tax=Thalassomonas actiniarum TaxID=485447 RepID=A0AAE9YRA1_9GAMM|nr:hypothetical protein [Thalassomonas actiniarum]WDD98849.1 hypothetical protein SG35_027085 [Thalassomonas actiniarum]